MTKLSKKNKKKTIITSEGIVVNSDKKHCNLFKSKPELSIRWIDEDGYELTHPDDIDELLKRNRIRKKEEWLEKKSGKKLKRKRKNIPDAQFEINNWDELLITIRNGSEWVIFTKMYDGKLAINEKFTLSYRQLGFNEPSIEFLRICATSNNTASFPYGKRKIKSRVDNTFRDLFRKDEEMSIVSHPNKKAHYYPLFKINHLDKDGNSIYGHTFGNEFAQLEEKK